MQINGFSNTFNLMGGLPARPNDSLQQPTSVVETSSPVSVQADAGRRVAATSSSDSPNRSAAAGQQNEAELAIIRELAARDREVRQHEMAHQMAGGQYTGAATYTFERGPDGVMYAVGGEVSIDTSPVAGDPEATLQKAQTIERAALAPADPSPQDLKVAASARAMANEARAELLREERESLESEASSEVLADPLLGDESPVSEIIEREAQERAQRLELQEAERLAAEKRTELDEAEQARQERREAIAEEIQQRRERQAEAMREFARDLAEIQAQLRELNKRLVETGALQGRNSLGSLLDREA